MNPETDNSPAIPTSLPQASGTYTPGIIEDIQIKAKLGRYRIRGFGILRPRTWATVDDLTFIPCGLDSAVPCWYDNLSY